MDRELVKTAAAALLVFSVGALAGSVGTKWYTTETSKPTR